MGQEEDWRESPGPQTTERDQNCNRHRASFSWLPHIEGLDRNFLLLFSFFFLKKVYFEVFVFVFLFLIQIAKRGFGEERRGVDKTSTDDGAFFVYILIEIKNASIDLFSF